MSPNGKNLIKTKYMLNDLQKTKLIPEAIAKYFEATPGMDGAKLSRVSKVGESYTNHIINGKTRVTNDSKKGYTEIADKYYTAICNTIGFTLDDKKSWKHFNTDNFKAIINQIKTVREAVDRGTVDGDTGAGKSHALSMYQKRFPVNTFVVKCFADENSKEFAINIAETVGVETHGTAGTITKRVCKKLLTLDDAILIIDEAEHIKNKSGYINIIKSLADRLENEVAFMLSGMDINEILQKNSDKHKQNFRQSARRFSKRMRCNDDISHDILKICEEYQISKTCANWLVARIKNFGELRNIITEALRESEISQQPITTQLLTSLYQC